MALEFKKDKSYPYYPTMRVVIPTGGEAVLAPTSATHIHFDANHHCINGQPGDRCWIEYRGDDYGASLHFQSVNGEWQSQEAKFISKVRSSKDATPTAAKWIVERALEIVREFAAQHPEVIQLAETQRVERELEGKREKLAEARKQVEALNREIAELSREVAQ